MISVHCEISPWTAWFDRLHSSIWHVKVWFWNADICNTVMTLRGIAYYTSNIQQPQPSITLYHFEKHL